MDLKKNALALANATYPTEQDFLDILLLTAQLDFSKKENKLFLSHLLSILKNWPPGMRAAPQGFFKRTPHPFNPAPLLLAQDIYFSEEEKNVPLTMVPGCYLANVVNLEISHAEGGWIHLTDAPKLKTLNIRNHFCASLTIITHRDALLQNITVQCGLIENLTFTEQLPHATMFSMYGTRIKTLSLDKLPALSDLLVKACDNLELIGRRPDRKVRKPRLDKADYSNNPLLRKALNATNLQIFECPLLKLKAHP